MAYKTRTELKTDYADNATGAIKAEYHRNFVDSAMVYGDLVMPEDLAFSVTNIPRKLEFTQSGFSYGMTANIINWEFDDVEQGHYLGLIDVDMSLDGNNVTYNIQLYADDIAVGSPFGYNTRDDSLRLSRTFSFPVVIGSNAAKIDVRIDSTQNQTISIYGVNWVMYRMGSD